MRIPRTVVAAVLFAAIASPVAFAQDLSLAGNAMAALLQRAKTCANQMKAIGFEFDEVRTELDLTPKLEIFFRDVSGDTPPTTPPAAISPECTKVANLLLGTRRFQYGGFRLAGVKIDFPGLRAVLIHRAVH
jgi:hypothetical protein